MKRFNDSETNLNYFAKFENVCKEKLRLEPVESPKKGQQSTRLSLPKT